MTRTNETYDMLLELVKTRMSVRKFRSDRIPEDAINKILEVARWAMSGANSQPWEFIVVTDPETKKQLRDAEHMVHRERYDMSKYMSNEDVIRYLYSLREATVPVHSASRGVTTDQKK
jgi:nitroreductase